MKTPKPSPAKKQTSVKLKDIPPRKDPKGGTKGKVTVPDVKIPVGFEPQ